MLGRIAWNAWTPAHGRYDEKPKDSYRPHCRRRVYAQRLRMRALATGPFPWIIGVTVLMIAAAYVWLAGSAVVEDETGGVQSAIVTNNGGSEQRLHRLWRGYFYAIPSVEGAIEVRCANGARKQIGYVTGYLHTKVRVTGKRPCERIAEGS